MPSAVDYLCQFADDFLRAAKIRCRLDVPGEIPPVPLTSQARHHLFLVVKEALNNAAKHSGASEVWFRVHADGPDFGVDIEDNGTGLCDEESANGDGVGNMKSRIATLCGACAWKKREPVGTAFSFTIPMPVA